MKLSDEEKETLDDLSGVAARHRLDLWDLVGLLQKARGVMEGGGSVLPARSLYPAPGATVSQIGTCDDCREEIPEGDVYTCRSLSREVERGGAIDVLHAEPTSVLCSRCSSFRGCGEAEAEPQEAEAESQEEADPIPPDQPPTVGALLRASDTRYPPARYLEWKDWVHTHSQCDEWTRWDTADAWFLTVDRTDCWHWLAAYAPGDGHSLAERKGVGASKADAMAQAAAWAEHHALHPSLLAALPSTRPKDTE